MTEKRPRGRPRGFHSEPSKNLVQSLDRAIDVLDLLAANAGMTLTEIASTLGQSPATIYRVLATFQHRAMVDNDSASQEWAIGPEAFRLGAAFLRRSNVTERARPLMRQLMEQTGETSNLGIAKGNKVIFISQVETHESIRAFFPPGTQAPMHASGIGKALLSRCSRNQLERLFTSTGFERFTPQTIISLDPLEAEIVRIREQGYAVDNEEKAIGMRCIAAPILNVHDEAVAGISVSGPTHRITSDRVAEIGRLVGDAAREISRGLGYRPADPMPL
ncbi:MAG: IclR family transcriptional regulator [Rhodobacteraceae bacterium]|nr:IclR family transcriptional regulator [Paracoccaceae bacterium]